MEADIALSSTAEPFLSASSVTRTRYAYQITASSLYSLLKEAYDYYIAEASAEQDAEAALSFDEWCDQQKRENPVQLLASSAFNGTDNFISCAFLSGS